VVWSDREAAILRCENPLPALAVASPSIAADRVYPERETIYPIQNGHLGDLIVASEDGKKPKRAEPLQKSDADHTFVMRRETWQSWGKYGIVSARGNSGTFEFYKGLIYGDIIAESDQLVVFRVAEKYCRIPDSENKPGQAERYHHGYCTLKLDDFVQDSLAQPLSEERVSEMFKKK
jgi:hypothetical protein